MTPNSQLRPRKVPEIEEYSFGDEMLLALSDRGIATSLNSSAQAIWQLCDGCQTLDQMSTMLADRFGFSQEVLRQELWKQVTETIAQFDRLGLLEWEHAVKSEQIAN
ncbi:MAG: PqqD family protein [Geitlerinemataceae cyanobacterium]